MCSIILRIGPDGVLIGANRDEMIDRPWEPPAAYWPELSGVVAGRDKLAGGTWLGLNAHGVMAAVLNRHASLGPAPGKRSRGELPLLALAQTTAAAAAAAITALDATLYRSFNLVTADANGAYFIRGVEHGMPDLQTLDEGTWMITSGAPNDTELPRIARHLPKFQAAPAAQWPVLLADNTAPVESAINITTMQKFGTVCSSVITLPKAGAISWLFTVGPPDRFVFTELF